MHIAEHCGALAGRRVAFETHGRGTPLIALHSGPGFGAATLRAGMAAVAARHAVTLVDLPGCGQASRHAGSGYPIEAYIEDVMLVRAAIEAPRPWLLGHGWGAILAVETALKYPHAVAGLVLVNPLRILGAGGQDNAAQLRQVELVDAGLMTRFGAKVLPTLQLAMQAKAPWGAVDQDRWWPQMWHTQWAGPVSPEWSAAMGALALGMEAYFAHKGQAMFDAESVWARYDMADRLAGVCCPVSTIASAGDANYVAPPHLHVDPLRAAKPDMPVNIVNDFGHFLMAEAPASMAAHLDAHVAAQSTS